jgi:hypothetical protein
MEQTKKYPTIDWTKNEYHQLKLAVDALKAICAREDKRHQMDEHMKETADKLGVGFIGGFIAPNGEKFVMTNINEDDSQSLLPDELK